MKPTSDLDDACPLTLTLLEPVAAEDTVDRKSVPGIPDKAIGGEEQNAGELFRGGCPPMQCDPAAKAVSNEGAIKWQFFGGAAFNECALPCGWGQRTVLA